MNKIKSKILEVLKELKDDYGVYAIKAEFEAEGTRVEELFLLNDLILKSDLMLTIKIGGCLAIRDLMTSKIFGASNIVSPMVESPYALNNFINIIDKVYKEDELKSVKFLINIETIKAVNSIDLILSLPNINKINGIVLGRSDLIGSMNLDKKNIENDQIYDLGVTVFKKAKELDMETIIGGTITKNSIKNIYRYYENNLLDKFETRKVCFDISKIPSNKMEIGIEKAIYFELLWLEYKENYYKNLYKEDRKRILELKKRN